MTRDRPRTPGKASTRSASPRNVSAARLHQKAGADYTFGGYTKVHNGDGSFTMRKT